MTIRFLLKYMSRPMHFFGSLGATGMLGGLALSMWLLILKVLTHQPMMDQHGSLFVVAGVLILAGIQLLGDRSDWRTAGAAFLSGPGACSVHC